MGFDPYGAYIEITCTDCLRSFPLNVAREENAEVLETACLFCSNTVKYIIDFSLPSFRLPKLLFLKDGKPEKVC